jgi:hypothetical protein
MSSSTSSSDPADPVPASSRGRWPRGTLVALALVAIACHQFLTVAWADPSEAAGNERTLAVAALDSDTRAVFVGTSHLRSGHPTDRYRCRTMNLPLDGGSYEMLEKVLERNLSRAPNVRLLVIEFDIVPLRTDTVALLKGDDRTLWDFGLTPADIYGAHPVKRADAEVAKALRPFLVGKPLTPQQLWYNRPPGWSRGATAPQRLPGYSPSDGRLGVGAPGGAAEASFPPLDSAVVARNRAALERIIGRYRTAGIAIALLSFPYYESYRRTFPPEYTAALNEVAPAVRGEARAWWNLEADPRFGPEDFRDTTHLNRRGGEKLTGIIAADVERLAGVR